MQMILWVVFTNFVNGRDGNNLQYYLRDILYFVYSITPTLLPKYACERKVSFNVYPLVNNIVSNRHRCKRFGLFFVHPHDGDELYHVFLLFNLYPFVDSTQAFEIIQVFVT